MTNCARRLGDAITRAVIHKQVAEILPKIEGETVLRLGQPVTVEAVNRDTRKVTIVTAQAARQIIGFDTVFKEPVTIIRPSTMLEPLNIDEINASWVGRF